MTAPSRTGSAQDTSTASESDAVTTENTEKNMSRLANKVALITGAGSGIGRESALLFAREGARVVCVDIDEGSAAETTEMVESFGGEAIAVTADVSSGADADAMVRTAEESFGGLHVMFNNAGIMHSDDGDSQSTSEAVWDLSLIHI